MRRCPATKRSATAQTLLGCWGSFNDPDVCDYTYQNMSKWGRGMFVTPGVVVDGKLVTTDLVDINLNIRILLGSSYYDDWAGKNEVFVKQDPLGNAVDPRHPWNQTTLPKPQKRDFNGKYTWVMSPRWFDKRTNRYLALDTGGGPIARFWATALAGLVDIGYIKATGKSVKIYLPKTAIVTRSRVRVEDSQVEQHNRARSRAHLFPGVCRGRRAVLLRKGDGRALRGPDEDVDRLQSAGTRRSGAASTRPCAACSRTTS